MAYQTVFRRYETKYLLTLEQKQRLVERMEPYMKLDKYGRSLICNLYYDTDTYRLIRRSIEKPVYKEKLRVRSYGVVASDGTVFVELKKKYEGVVYKRRIPLPQSIALAWLAGEVPSPKDTQITREIDYFLQYYGSPCPKVHLSYEREAYFSKDGSDFRVTFDENILVREDALSLSSAPAGKTVLGEGQVLMEIKCSGGIPLWMTAFLSEQKIYKTSFSKYGKAYEYYIFPTLSLARGMKKKEEIANATAGSV